jgi:hypothetical protein
MIELTHIRPSAHADQTVFTISSPFMTQMRTFFHFTSNIISYYVSGKFIAIRDGTNLTEIFGEGETPWEKRFKHSMSLPFYQAHPDQLERIEDNFDYFYRNLLGRKIR